MRVLGNDEMKQRGCAFCRELKRCRHCPHAECPYHDLDNVEIFDDYCATFPDLDLRELLKDM